MRPIVQDPALHGNTEMAGHNGDVLGGVAVRPDNNPDCTLGHIDDVAYNRARWPDVVAPVENWSPTSNFSRPVACEPHRDNNPVGLTVPGCLSPV